MTDRRTALALAIPLLLGALCAPAAALDPLEGEEVIACQAQEPQLSLGFFVGFGVHLDDAGIGGETTEAKDSAHPGVRAAWLLGSTLALEAEVRLGSATFSGFEGALTALGYRVGFLLHLRQGDWRPFVLFGHGGDLFFREGTGFDGAGGFVSNHLGVGLKIRHDHRLGLRLEGRAAINRADQSPTTELIEVNAGIYMEF